MATRDFSGAFQAIVAASPRVAAPVDVERVDQPSGLRGCDHLTVANLGQPFAFEPWFEFGWREAPLPHVGAGKQLASGQVLRAHGSRSTVAAAPLSTGTPRARQRPSGGRTGPSWSRCSNEQVVLGRRTWLLGLLESLSSGLMSRRRPSKTKRGSRAEVGTLRAMRSVRVLHTPDAAEAILTNPPADAEAFVDAVLIAEGRDPVVVSTSGATRTDSDRDRLDVRRRVWPRHDVRPAALSVG